MVIKLNLYNYLSHKDINDVENENFFGYKLSYLSMICVNVFKVERVLQHE